MPIGWLYGTYHLLGEPETTIDTNPKSMTVTQIRQGSTPKSWVGSMADHWNVFVTSLLGVFLGLVVQKSNPLNNKNKSSFNIRSTKISFEVHYPTDWNTQKSKSNLIRHQERSGRALLLPSVNLCGTKKNIYLAGHQCWFKPVPGGRWFIHLI